jgi:hypothetical protein
MKSVSIQFNIQDAANCCHTMSGSDGFGNDHKVHLWLCDTSLELLLICKVLDGLGIQYETDEFVWESGACDWSILIDIPWEPYVKNGLFVIEGGEA